MDHQSLIDTIKRLLALGSRNPNEHEAAAALAKARELMERHNLDMATVAAADVAGGTAGSGGGGPCAWTEESGGARIPYHATLASKIVLRFFHVEVIVWHRGPRGQRRSEFRLFGRPENVAVGCYALVWLVRTFHRLWSAHRRHTAAPLRLANTFYQGLAEGLLNKLEAQERTQRAAYSQGQRNALVVVRQDLRRAFGERYPDIRKARTPEPPANREGAGEFWLGFIQGKKIEIPTAVADQKQQKTLLLEASRP